MAPADGPDQHDDQRWPDWRTAMQLVRGNDLTHHLPDMPIEPGIRFALGSNGVRDACPKLLGKWLIVRSVTNKGPEGVTGD